METLPSTLPATVSALVVAGLTVERIRQHSRFHHPPLRLPGRVADYLVPVMLKACAVTARELRRRANRLPSLASASLTWGADYRPNRHWASSRKPACWASSHSRMLGYRSRQYRRCR